MTGAPVPYRELEGALNVLRHYLMLIIEREAKSDLDRQDCRAELDGALTTLHLAIRDGAEGPFPDHD
jgi:hypothetical protein